MIYNSDDRTKRAIHFFSGDRMRRAIHFFSGDRMRRAIHFFSGDRMRRAIHRLSTAPSSSTSSSIRCSSSSGEPASIALEPSLAADASLTCTYAITTASDRRASRLVFIAGCLWYRTCYGCFGNGQRRTLVVTKIENEIGEINNEMCTNSESEVLRNT